LRAMVLVLLLVSVANALHYTDLEEGNYVIYDILDFNDAADITWVSSSGFRAWHASEENVFLYEIVGFGGNSGPYDPRSEQYWANIWIGNLSLQNVSDYEVADNLVFSLYPHYFGVIADTDWGAHADAVNNIPNASVDVSYSAERYLGTSLDTITFWLSHSSQQTTLTYDTGTGLLLYAKTGFGNYWLEMTIEDTNIIRRQDSTVPIIAAVFLIIGVGGSLWLIIRR
jgi:hypothetical protein